MLSENENAQAKYGGDRRKQNGGLERSDMLFASFILLLQAIHNEDTVVVSEAKNERGEDDIDDIELNIEYAHDAENPHPTDEHRNECDERELYAAVGDKQREEYQQRRHPCNVIELIIYFGYETVGGILLVQYGNA